MESVLVGDRSDDGPPDDGGLESIIVRLIRQSRPASLLVVQPDPQPDRSYCHPFLRPQDVHRCGEVVSPVQIRLGDLLHPPKPDEILHTDVACLLLDASMVEVGDPSFDELQSTIAHWRNSWPKQLWVGLWSSRSTAIDTMMRALGFFALPTAQLDAEKNGSCGVEWIFFSYSLENYKSIPDWLNADFWANPERWDLE